MDKKQKPEFMPAYRAAAFFGVTPQTVWSWGRKGQIQMVRRCGIWQLPMPEFMRLWRGGGLLRDQRGDVVGVKPAQVSDEATSLPGKDEEPHESHL